MFDRLHGTHVRHTQMHSRRIESFDSKASVFAHLLDKPSDVMIRLLLPWSIGSFVAREHLKV